MDIHSDASKRHAETLIRGSTFANYADELIDLLLPTARIEICDDSSAQSYLGGLPCMPRDMDWPVWDKRDLLVWEIAFFEEKYKQNRKAIALRDAVARRRQELKVCKPIALSFLAQISLDELSCAAPLPLWPTEGTLLFFCDPLAWGNNPLYRGHCRVLFLRDQAKLEQVSYHPELPDQSRFPRCPVFFKREWTLPTFFREQNIESGPKLGAWREKYDNLRGQLRTSSSRNLPIQARGNPPIHQCGGHPDEIQYDMRPTCQLAASGIFDDDELRRKAAEHAATDWQLLIQLDSDFARLGWRWYGYGRIYFWARKQDIESANFEGAWSLVQDS